MGLYGLLLAMGVGQDDEVLLQAPTHIVVANAVRYTGARPVFVDCDPCNYNMDLALAEQRITAIVSGAYAWDMRDAMPVPVTRPYLDGVPVNELRQLELAITPHGFLKTALAAKDAKAIRIQYIGASDFGLSQFGLLLHGLNLWKGGDTLAVIRQRRDEPSD